MTCESCRTELLLARDPAQAPAHCANHLVSCGACREVRVRAIRLAELMHRLPAPDSNEARLALLDRILNSGPIIATKPTIPSESHTLRALNLKPLFKTINWRVLSGLAAGVMVAGLGVFLFTRPSIEVAEVPEKPKHELLKKAVRHDVELAKATAPKDRLAIFAEWSRDLKTEACSVYKVAPKDDMNSLASSYESIVRKGVMAQVRSLKEIPLEEKDRAEAMQNTLKTLAEAEVEADRLSFEAPPDSQAALRRIAAAAKDARQRVLQVAADGQGGGL